MLRYVPWATLLMGIWLVVAPYILGFAEVTTALVNSIVLGLILPIASAVCLYYQYSGAHNSQQTAQQKA